VNTHDHRKATGPTDRALMIVEGSRLYLLAQIIALFWQLQQQQQHSLFSQAIALFWQLPLKNATHKHRSPVAVWQLHKFT